MAELHLVRHSMYSYLREFVTQYRYAQTGWAALGAELARDSTDGALCFAAAQNILTAAAQMSKLLWPNIDRKWSAKKREYVEQRGLALRGFVEPDGVLRERSVRNGIEHFDERLDAFFLDPGPTALIDRVIGPADAFSGGGAERPLPIMRHLDPSDLSIAVLDARISLPALMDAMQDVAVKANAWAEKSRDELNFLRQLIAAIRRGNNF